MLIAGAAVFVAGLLIGLRYQGPALLAATLALLVGHTAAAVLGVQRLSLLDIVLQTALLQIGYLSGLLATFACSRWKRRQQQL